MPNVPDFRNIARATRAGTDTFSYKNIIQKVGQTGGSTATAPQGPIQPGYTSTVRTTYPNAVLAEAFGSRCTSFIQTLCGYAPNDVVTAASICSDDKNAPVFPGNTFGQYPVSLQAFLGPFFAGGIGGYPFPGIVGTFAWASHVTDTGALFIYSQPHIGITATGEVGFMVRQGQSSNSATCGAVNAAQNRIIGPLSATPPAFPSAEFTVNDFQQYTLTNILYTDTTTRNALTANRAANNDVSNPTNAGFGARMKIATDAIRDAANTVLETTIIPAAYAALSGALGAAANFNSDLFLSSGTFINVDDGYKAYVDVTSFKKYNPDTQTFTNYTSQFSAGL